jgi:hypothetical protein
MLYDFDVSTTGWQICPISRAADHMSVEQRRSAGWVVQGMVVPKRGNRPLCNGWPGAFRVWRITRDGSKFVGFLALDVGSWSRALERYVEATPEGASSQIYKQLLVSNDHFTKYFSYGPGARPCNIIFGHLSFQNGEDGSSRHLVAGSVFNRASGEMLLEHH